MLMPTARGADNSCEITLLCSASAVSSDLGDPSFDPSLQLQLGADTTLALPALLLPSSHPPAHLRVRLEPLSCKVVPATVLTVAVHPELLGSPVPASALQQRLVQRGATLHLSVRRRWQAPVQPHTPFHQGPF